MEQHLFNQIVELLGKPPTEHVDLLESLVQDLGEKPDIQHLSQRDWSYDFEQSGICLYFDSELGIFNGVDLNILTARIRAGNMKPYVGNLPWGINADDSEKDVSKKLYEKSPKTLPDENMAVGRTIVVSCHSDSAKDQVLGLGDSKLAMVSVRYRNKYTRVSFNFD